MQEKSHVALVWNDQVELSVFGVQGQALPAVEGKAFQFLAAQGVDKLSHHPESRGCRPVGEGSDVVNHETS